MCQTANKPAKILAAPLHLVPLPFAHYLKLGIYIVGPFQHVLLNCRLMYAVDNYYRRWPEVLFAREFATGAVTPFLLSLFRRKSYSLENVSDHGSLFTSVEFKTFLRERGIPQLY